MSNQAGDKRGLTVSLILLAVIALIAILIFWLMLGRTSSEDPNKGTTSRRAINSTSEI